MTDPQDSKAKTSDNSGGFAAGVAAHKAKMRLHTSQVRGEGAMTGGFATSPGAPKVTNKQGKFYAKGKN